MDDSDDVLAAMERHLQDAEAELTVREKRAREGDAPPEVLLALAAERDKIALERDAIADVQGENATARDRTAAAASSRGHTEAHQGSPQRCGQACRQA